MAWVYRKSAISRRPKYDLIATLSVPLDFTSPVAKYGFDTFYVRLTTSQLSKDGKTAAIG